MSNHADADQSSDRGNAPSAEATDDGRLAAALEDYLARCDAGATPDLHEFLQEYADVADSLRMALDGLNFVGQFAPHLMDHSTDGADPLNIEQDPAGSPGTTRLGDFQILREIGRGGMGIVYEAHQEMLGRRVALKVLPFAAMLDERQQMRFRNEARAAATLNHPNIVPVHSVGIERGVHYYAMQYVDGQSLAALLESLRTDTSIDNRNEVLKTRPVRKSADTLAIARADLSTVRLESRNEYFRTTARMGVELANAIQHAHGRGVVHRDIQPANIMINSEGEALITDFGLARLDDSSDLTLTGDIVGTLRYAPPEQVLGDQEYVDARVDVYSLGMTLYEVLSLRPAFDAKNREKLIRQITQGQAPRLRSLDASIPKDLETIIHKAIEVDPLDRFASATDFADELTRFLEHRPLVSRRPGVASRLAKWTRRHPWPVLLSLLFAIVSFIGISIAMLAVNSERSRAEAERDEAIQNLEIALATVDEMYGDFAEQWVAGDQALSDTQTHFLQRAAELYDTIADRFA